MDAVSDYVSYISLAVLAIAMCVAFIVIFKDKLMLDASEDEDDDDEDEGRAVVKGDDALFVKPAITMTPNQEYVYRHSKKLAKLRLICRQIDERIASCNLGIPRTVSLPKSMSEPDAAEFCAGQQLDACMILVNACRPFQEEIDGLSKIQVDILNDGALAPDGETLSAVGMTAKVFFDTEWELAWMVRPKAGFGRLFIGKAPGGVLVPVSLASLDTAVKTVLIQKFSNTVKAMRQFHEQTAAQLDIAVSQFLYITDEKRDLRSFRNWTIEGFLKSYLKEHYDAMRQWLEHVDKNRRLVSELDAVYDAGVSSGDERSYQMIAGRISITEEEYYQIVNRICRSMRIAEPNPGAWMITYTYTSPQGKNHYEKLYRLYAEELRRHLDAYQKRDEHLSFAEKQRRLMTPSLRYQVLREDGFRCVLCGRGQEDGVKLEVDHILPVSKGGRTIRSNLRTLCWDCNQGKHDSYDPNGLN